MPSAARHHRGAGAFYRQQLRRCAFESARLLYSQRQCPRNERFCLVNRENKNERDRFI